MAPAGCKLISGDKRFWHIAADAFEKLDKGCTSDALFQLLAGANLLKVPKSFPAASLPHFSARTGSMQCASDFTCEPRLRPLPVLGVME